MMMMMAELAQGQASVAAAAAAAAAAAVAQPGMKTDGFADALHRARQVTLT